VLRKHLNQLFAGEPALPSDDEAALVEICRRVEMLIEERDDLDDVLTEKQMLEDIRDTEAVLAHDRHCPQGAVVTWH